MSGNLLLIKATTHFYGMYRKGKGDFI
jgi:hypothetical protein